MPPAPRTRAGNRGPGGPGGPGARGHPLSLTAPPHCASRARHQAEAGGGEAGRLGLGASRARAAARADVWAGGGSPPPLAAQASRAHSRRGSSEAAFKPLRLDRMLQESESDFDLEICECSNLGIGMGAVKGWSSCPAHS